MNNCGTCGIQCNSTVCDSCKNACLSTGFQWGIIGCELKARYEGQDVPAINLCDWLKDNETCTKLSLVPGDDDCGGYLQYDSECSINKPETNHPNRICICDLLSLGTLGCLGNVSEEADYAEPCSYLVYNPCDNPCGEKDKWVPKTVPRADCTEKELITTYVDLDECGCLVQKCSVGGGMVYQYKLRDSVPNDPDWPFTYGSFTEDIDLMLNAPELAEVFGKSDLDITIEYGFGIQNAAGAIGGDAKNFKSMVTPIVNGVQYTDGLNCWTVQGNNSLPWGSHEWQVSRTFPVKAGDLVRLHHEVQVLQANGQKWISSLNPNQTTGGSASTCAVPTIQQDCSRLHALTITVRPAQVKKLVLEGVDLYGGC